MSKVIAEIRSLEARVMSKKSDLDGLKEEVRKFEKLQSSLSDWGASDSEPNWFFASLMRKAIKGDPMPEIKAENWELYTSESGWRGAAQKLTRAVTALYKKIQTAPHSEVLALSQYYGWGH